MSLRGASPVATFYIAALGFFVSILSFGSGCAWFGSSSATVYEDEKVRVSREADPSLTSGAHNDHPATLETAQITMLLKGLEVERQPGLLKSLVSGPTREPAFNELEITALAPHVKEALARVSPEERVSFVLRNVSSTQSPEVTSGKVWVRAGRVHFLLDRYRAPEGGQSRIPTPYQSSFSRGQATSQRVQPDYVVLFSPNSYVTKHEPGMAVKLLASPETEVVIDHQRFFADMRQAPDRALAVASTDERRGTTSSELSSFNQQDSQANVRALADRIKTLENQVTDLVDIVKKLTLSLEDARKTLAAKDEQIQMLLRGNPPSRKKPKPSSP